MPAHTDSRPRHCVCLLATVVLTLAGCDPASMGQFRGVAEKMGAKAVNGSSDEEIREMFRKTNDQCPVKMDQFTTLESVVMVDDKNIEFNYRVTDQGRKLVQGISKDRMRKSAVTHMKGNAMAVAVAERDLTIRHIYEDRFGGHILSYTINKTVLAGGQALGEEQGNPFAVNTVSSEPEQDVTEPEQSPEDSVKCHTAR